MNDNERIRLNETNLPKTTRRGYEYVLHARGTGQVAPWIGEVNGPHGWEVIRWDECGSVWTYDHIENAFDLVPVARTSVRWVNVTELPGAGLESWNPYISREAALAAADRQRKQSPTMIFHAIACRREISLSIVNEGSGNGD